MLGSVQAAYRWLDNGRFGRLYLLCSDIIAYYRSMMEGLSKVFGLVQAGWVGYRETINSGCDSYR